MTAPADGGHVTQDYGVPGDYAAGVHTGRDWAGGSYRIVATRSGVVTFAGWAGDYGLRVEIDTDGVQHSYSHLETILAWAGQHVAEGQQIGWMGDTGNSTGIHCHYEERTGGHGYNDHRRPQWDTATAVPDEPEEDLMAGKLVVFFTRDGAIYEADVTGGTYRWIENPDDLRDRQHVLTSLGIPWQDWEGGREVANPEAFGRLVA